MPASATSSSSRPETLIRTLTLANLKPSEGDSVAKVIREIKNQIIGNKTKKLLYLKLGAVPSIVAVLASASQDLGGGGASVIVQAAASLGSFACGVEEGVRAVIDAGAVPHLIRILSHPDEKVVDAGARSLRMIFQSKLAPKHDLLQEKSMRFLLSLLNSENENMSELAASIISHSCGSNSEQKALCDVGVLERLLNLLKGSLNQRDSFLDSIATIVRGNSEVASRFSCINNGKALASLTELVQDRSSRTRLLACVCLIAIGHASPCYSQDLKTKTKLVITLIELLEEPGQVGDDAPFALSNLLSGDEELHKTLPTDVTVKLCNFLMESTVHARRLEGLLLALAELCSKLERWRCQLMSFQVLDIISDALKHDLANVRIAACMCLKSISRSAKNLSAGSFSNGTFLVPLIQLSDDSCAAVQVAALDAICNVATDFNPQKSAFIQVGGVTQLVVLSRSMNSTVRLKSLCALRNLMFLGDKKSRQDVLMELTTSTLASLISDSELLVQEQAMALISNYTDGCVDNIDYVINEDSNIIAAVVRQLHSSSSPEVYTQGMFLLSNIAAGEESHKEAVMSYLVPLQLDTCTTLFIIKFLQCKHNLLRTAAVWCIVNLTRTNFVGASSRIARLQDAGVISQIRSMVNDPFLDCKFQVRTALGQCTSLENISA